MIIKVTKEHIHQGIRCSTRACPIALAVGEALQTLDVEVGMYAIYALGKKYYTGYKICFFIQDFDKNQHVEPFEFELRERCESK